MSDQNDDKKTAPTSLGDATISRRKLAYVAPLFISRRMIYRAAGCGKSQGRIINCQHAPRGS